MAESFTPTRAIRQFAEVLMPKDAVSPILSKPIRAAVHQWRVELGAARDLKAVGLEPRRTALMFGPPGCGKTTLAHHLSARLGLPLVVVNMAALTSSYIGETGRNINALFDEVIDQADSCVLFLDEFDSLCSKRKESRSSGDSERNAIVVSLLQKIDQFPGTMLAATNRADDIDPAIWRRFGIHLDIVEPDDECRYAIICRYLQPYDLPEEAITELTVTTAGASPALLRQLVEGIKRDLVISPKLQQPIDAKSVFNRLLASVKPHTDAQQPPLWTTRDARKRIDAISWPPTLTMADVDGAGGQQDGGR